MSIDFKSAEVYSPEWWFRRCLNALLDTSPYCRGWVEYHAGAQPLMFASEKFSAVYGERYGKSRSNFMPLVVDAESERMIVQGFRFGSSAKADKSIWQLWQENDLDSDSQIVHELALTAGMSYVMVTKGADDRPLITVESAQETVVLTDPAKRRHRLAGLKVIAGDSGHWEAFLHLPDGVYTYRSASQRTTAEATTGLGADTAWDVYVEDGFDWPLPQPLHVVPIVPFANRPMRNGRGRSELEPVAGNQDAINKLRFDALVASEYVAFPQRWATNIDIPVNPDTGQPIAPFKPGVDNLWVVRRPTPQESVEYADKVPAAQLGQFPAADLSPYLRMIEMEIGAMASNGRTPYHYLLGSPTSVPPSGESLKASEAPLVKKVGRQRVHFGESWEEVMRLALMLSGQSNKARADGETMWVDAETRNESAHNDVIIKQHQEGLLPDEFALEELGYSATQIERIKAQLAAVPPEPQPTLAQDTAGNIIQMNTGT
jgi:hypothetical protein